MSDEIRNEEVEVMEAVEAEDVKEGLTLPDYGVIGGIMIAGIAAFEGGKLVWKKTEAPRKKVWNGIKSIFTKNTPEKETKEDPEHEVASSDVAEATEEKKSESKKGNSKK